MPLLICCVNKPKHSQLKELFTYLLELMLILCNTRGFLGGGSVTVIEDFIQEIIPHN